MDKLSSRFFITVVISGLLGMLLGAIVYNALISIRIDNYLEEIAYLNNLLDDKEVRLKKLEESINKQKYILSDITLYILTEKDEDEVDKLVLEKSIKEKYSNLIGKEVKDIDIELAAEIIDKRIMKVNGHEYQLIVRRIMLSDILSIWIDIKRLSENN